MNEEERKLLTEPFPVLFGIRPNRIQVTRRVGSSIRGEVGMMDGVQPDEIKVLYVPTEKIPYVKDLLKRSEHQKVHVESLEVLKAIVGYQRAGSKKDKTKKFEPLQAAS